MPNPAVQRSEIRSILRLRATLQRCPCSEPHCVLVQCCRL
ncbi:hypothetical protein SVAN01_02425 [Stagonosporopsis vannaccii]|nr:hypothetical protein SVAN01_02425 [Stagonosporopsis vannaccii]